MDCNESIGNYFKNSFGICKKVFNSKIFNRKEGKYLAKSNFKLFFIIKFIDDDFEKEEMTKKRESINCLFERRTNDVLISLLKYHLEKDEKINMMLAGGMIDDGIDVNFKDENGENALFYASILYNI